MFSATNSHNSLTQHTLERLERQNWALNFPTSLKVFNFSCTFLSILISPLIHIRLLNILNLGLVPIHTRTDQIKKA